MPTLWASFPALSVSFSARRNNSPKRSQTIANFQSSSDHRAWHRAAAQFVRLFLNFIPAAGAFSFVTLRRAHDYPTLVWSSFRRASRECPLQRVKVLIILVVPSRTCVNRFLLIKQCCPLSCSQTEVDRIKPNSHVTSCRLWYKFYVCMRQDKANGLVCPSACSFSWPPV
jgi:hypothetical protein